MAQIFTLCALTTKRNALRFAAIFPKKEFIACA
jgi:hypothetical protein